MKSSKKKPRQRNRPRNKANRLNAQEKAPSPERKENCEDNHSVVPTSITNGNEKSNQMATETITEPIDSIKIIQKVMRAKLLKDSKDSKEGVSGSSQRSQELLSEDRKEKNVFMKSLQKKMENVMSSVTDSNGSQSMLLENLQNLLFSQAPASDVESSADEEECIEYIYKPRDYFLVSLCNHCKCDLCVQEALVECSRCHMSFYCCNDHMEDDKPHRQLCKALGQMADECGGHVFNKCAAFTTDEFRSYRIVTIRHLAAILDRPLTATEQEVVLFPRICSDGACREYRFSKLMDCKKCGQISYCRDNETHLNKQHERWCKSYQLFKELVIFQKKFGRLDPPLPTKVLNALPKDCNNTKQILKKLDVDMQNGCEYAALTQISTGPLTAWYALRLCGQLELHKELTIHLIGAEIEFEVDVLQKWELFFVHIAPFIQQLNVIFIGPELKPHHASFNQLQKTKCCRLCRKSNRKINYFFVAEIYHEYCKAATFIKPNLICFFNAGLYRSTGFKMSDTWPETIQAAANLKTPIVVTAYTEYEIPLDMRRLIQECNRRVNVVLPPILNPFASIRPERNFISDEEAPLMFKNYYCFVVE